MAVTDRPPFDLFDFSSEWKDAYEMDTTAWKTRMYQEFAYTLPLAQVTIPVTVEPPLEELLAEALAWVNDVRAEYNLEALTEMPRGYAGSASGCALAQAISEACTGSLPEEEAGRDRHGSRGEAAFMHDGELVTRPIPEKVQRFMNAFDSGLYPDLVKEITFGVSITDPPA